MTANDDSGFDIADFAPVHLLGEGVWGRVYDLGDGTVLKIARETCAGIGSGRAKIANECAALTLLSAAGKLHGLVPVVCGHGDVPASSPLAAQGFAMWLRMTKLPGRDISPDEIERLSHREQSIIGRNIGGALARVHEALGAALTLAGKNRPQIERPAVYAEIAGAAQQPDDASYKDAIATMTKVRRRIPSAILARPTHGDFNTSNILLTRAGDICGVLDFAEWGADFPEKDFAHVLQELPALADHVIAAYERESGFTTDPVRLALGLAENALFGAVISERQNDVDGVRSCRKALSMELKKLPG
jgi:Phosphotransferase enzyme family